MPWGALIIGAFFIGGVTVMLQYFVIGTDVASGIIRTVVPWSLFGTYILILVFGLFGERH